MKKIEKITHKLNSIKELAGEEYKEASSEAICFLEERFKSNNSEQMIKATQEIGRHEDIIKTPQQDRITCMGMNGEAYIYEIKDNITTEMFIEAFQKAMLFKKNFISYMIVKLEMQYGALSDEQKNIINDLVNNTYRTYNGLTNIIYHSLNLDTAKLC